MFYEGNSLTFYYNLFNSKKSYTLVKHVIVKWFFLLIQEILILKYEN